MDKSIVTFAGGCFWCTEALFLQLKRVASVMSGYIGGVVENPTHQQICTGTTGHANAIQILYDEDVTGFETLLEVFFATHNPTRLNRQGTDVGTQYRSEIFYHSDNQKMIDEVYIQQLEEAHVFDSPTFSHNNVSAAFIKI